MELWDKICDFCEQSGIDGVFRTVPGVICAYSGGADSSVLLRFLKRRLEALGIPLFAAHVNHMIRGDEGDGDEEFCRRTAEELSIPFFSFRADVPAIAERRGLGLEECAREERYAILSRLSEKLGGAAVATAHSATDNLETVIFNLCRGSGIDGMCGIDPVRGVFIRPLLCCTAEEIRDEAARLDIDFVTDSTNSDTQYTRNYIRSVIVPAMRHVNPRADAAARRLSDAAREDSAFLDKCAAEFLGGRDKVARDALQKLDKSVFARTVRLMKKNAAGSGCDLSAAAVAACRDLILSGGCGRVDIGGNLSFFSHKDGAFVGTVHNETQPSPAYLAVPGITHFGEYIATVLEKADNIYNLSIYIAVDFDKIYGRPYLRCRAPGDRILCGGHHKKLKKLMCDAAVPQQERSLLPLICDDRGIIAVPGVAVRDGCRAGAQSKNVLHIYIDRKVSLQTK